MLMKQPKTNQKENSNGLDKYAKYSGLAVQMILIILIFVWAGKKLDEKFMDEKQVFVIVFSLLGVFTGLYVALKDFINFKGKK